MLPTISAWVGRLSGGNIVLPPRMVPLAFGAFRSSWPMRWWTAARPGAVLELTWDRVDLRAGRIDLGAAPRGKGRAIVPIGQKLLPLLEEARKTATCPYVIEHGSKPVGSVKTGTRAAARRAGLHGVTPHVLRHTGATWMAIGGVPLDQIGRLLGHSDPRLTLRVYATIAKMRSTPCPVLCRR